MAADDLPPSLREESPGGTVDGDLPPSLAGGDDLPPSLSNTEPDRSPVLDATRRAAGEILSPLTRPFSQASTPTQRILAPAEGAADFAARPLFQPIPGTREYADQVKEFYQPQSELDQAAEEAGRQPGGIWRNFPVKPYVKRVGAEALAGMIPTRPIDVITLAMPGLSGEEAAAREIPRFSPEEPPPGLPPGPKRILLPPGRTEGPGFTMADQPNMAAASESEAYAPRLARNVVRRQYQTGEIPPIQPADLPPSLQSADRLALPPGPTEGPGFTVADEPNAASFGERDLYSPKRGNIIARRGYREDLPPSLQEGMPSTASSSGESITPSNTSATSILPRSQDLVEGFQSSENVREPSDTSLPTALPGPNRTGPSTTLADLGSIHPTSNRKITQLSTDVNALLDQAKTKKPDFDSTLREISDTVPGARFNGSRVKEMVGVARKLKSRPPETITDYLGGRISVDSEAEAQQVVDALAKRGRIIDDDGSFAPRLGGYAGRHVQVDLGDGLTAEVQIAPHEIADAQKAAHAEYKKFRIPRITEEEKNAAMARSDAIMSDARNKYMARIQGNRDLLPETPGRSMPPSGLSRQGQVPHEDLLDGFRQQPDQPDLFGGSTRAPAPSYETAGNTQLVPLSDIRTSPERFQPRNRLIQSRVDDIADNMRANGYNAAKPIQLWRDPQDNQLRKEVAGLQRDIAGIQKSLGKSLEGPPNLKKLFPEKPSGEAGFATLGKEATGPQPAYGSWQEAQRALIDRYQPIKYKAGAEIAPEFSNAGGKYTDAYVMASTFTGKARGAWEMAFNERNQILKPLQNFQDRQVFDRIVWLRHFMDLDRLGKTTSGVTAEFAQKELAEMRLALGAERFNRIAQVATDFTKWYSRSRLSMMVKGKLISPETAQMLEERYPNYVPTEILDTEMKKVDPLYEPLQPLGRVKAGFLKTKVGTDKLVNTDVLDVTSRGYAQVAMAAEKQKVIDKIADEFGQTIGQRLFQDGQLITKVNPTKIPAGWIRSNVKVSDGRIIAVSPEVDRLLRGLDVESLDMVSTAMSKFNAVFRHSATGWRTAFAMGHAVRAFESALINRRPIPNEAAFIPSLIRGTTSAVKEALGIPDALYREWITGGGGFGGLATSVKAASTQKIPFRLLSGSEQLKAIAESPFEALGKFTRASDNVIRLSEYARLKPTDLPEPLKILQSRRVPIDFEKYGDSMRLMNRWVPFINDKVQADVNALQVARDHPIMTVGRLTAYAAAPAVAFYAWNQKFPDLEKLVPERFKEQYFYVQTGNKTSDGNPIVIAVPKKGPIALISNITDGLLEKASKNPAFQQRLKDYEPSAMAQKAAATVLPPLFRAPVEQAFNVNMYNGQPIVSDKLKDVQPKYQFKPYTTNTARYIGEKTGMSPVRLESAARSIFPASGQVFEAASPLFKKSVSLPREEKDSVYAAQNFQPFVRVPAQHYSLPEEQARDYEQTQREAGRTPAFMLNQAYARYLTDRTPENLQRVQDWAQQTPPQQRVRAMQQARRDFVNQQLSPEERARRRVPLIRRGRFSASLQEGN